MTKKLTPYEKNKLAWEKRDAILDAVLVAYTKNIKHDYPIPGHYDIRQSVVRFTNASDFKKNVQESSE